jgi:hypothetical protein
MIIEVEKINETFAILKCDRSIAQELNEYFAFYATGYKFMPAYKSRLWDGLIRLAKILPNGDVEFFIGLIHQLKVFCKDKEYTLNLNYNENYNPVSDLELHKFVTKLNIHSNGNKIEVRDYQFKGALDFLNEKRLVLLSPTSCLDPNTIIDVHLDKDAETFLINHRNINI